MGRCAADLAEALEGGADAVHAAGALLRNRQLPPAVRQVIQKAGYRDSQGTDSHSWGDKVQEIELHPRLPQSSNFVCDQITSEGEELAHHFIPDA